MAGLARGESEKMPMPQARGRRYVALRGTNVFGAKSRKKFMIYLFDQIV
jgi:hypothetical protein